MIAYHVTRKQHLKQILEHGLTPRTGENSAEFGEEGDAVYCFRSMASCEDALMNWLGECVEEDEELVILSLEIDGLSTRPVEVEWEVAIEETVPPDRVVAAVGEDGKPIALSGKKRK